MVTGGGDIAVSDFDIDNMPVTGCIVADLRAGSVGVTILVRSCGPADKIRCGQIIFVGGEQRIDFAFNYRREARVGNDTDNLVAFVAPGQQRGSRGNYNH